jgi:hypothetical protein
MAVDADVRSVINARLAGRSRTKFTAEELTAKLSDDGVHTSQEEVVSALDSLVREGKLKRRKHHVYWRWADEPLGPVWVYRASAPIAAETP